MMNVPRETLGLSGGGYVDIMELKCNVITNGSLLKAYGKGKTWNSL